MFKTGGDPSNIIEERDLGQTSDEDVLSGIVDAVLVQNEGPVQDYKNGKENAITWGK